MNFKILVDKDESYQPIDPRFHRLNGFNLKDIESGKLAFCSLIITVRYGSNEHIFTSTGYPLCIGAPEEELMDDLSDLLDSNKIIERLHERVLNYYSEVLPLWKI